MKEILELFEDDYIHLGGDEVYFPYWETKPVIKEIMKKLGIETYEEL